MKNKQRGSVEGVLAIIIVAAFIGFIVWLAVAKPDLGSGQGSATPTAPAEKPQTKTRCDFTGWGSASIIEEEAANGYLFTGRVMGIFCENSLAFELKEQQ